MDIANLPPELRPFAGVGPAHRKGLKILVSGPPKSGKGLVPETPVLTPDGWKPLQHIKVGDAVVGSDGEPTLVLARWDRGVQPCYRVRFHDGREITTDSAHIWRVYSRRAGRFVLKTSPELRSALRAGDTLYTPLVIWAGREQRLPVDPWLLGLLIADGGLTGSTPRITKRADQLDPLIRAALPPGVEATRKDLDWFLVHGKGRVNPMTLRLRELGLWGKKSPERFIPLPYMNASTRQRLALLQGLMDGDGAWENGYVYTTSSPVLARQVQDLVRSLGGSCGPFSIRETATYPSIRISFRVPFVSFRGPKAEQVPPVTKPPRSRIVSVEPVEPRETICIAVWASDGLFVADGFTVTHNSYFLAHFPRPLVAFDCGEAGIQPYLQPDDVWFEVTNPAAAKAGIDWVLKHEDEIASLVIDPVTTLWSDWMDYWAQKLESEGKLREGDQIQAGHWRRIKGPWKRHVFFPLQRAPFHVGLAAWPKEIEFSQEETAPGLRSSLQVRTVQEAQVEKTLRFLYDLWFQTGIELDQLNRPTSKHWIRLAGGRRPMSVPPSEFYTGRTWRFDARKPENPWEKVVSPWLEHWTKGPGAMDHLGPRDPQEVDRVLRQLADEEAEAWAGRLVAQIEKIDSLDKLRDLWAQITSEWSALDDKNKALLTRAKDRRKQELEG